MRTFTMVAPKGLKKRKKPLFKIDRTRWWTGSVPNSRSDEMCVIGHIAEQLGVPTTDKGTGRNRSVIEALQTILGGRAALLDRLIYQAQEINDDDDFDNGEKEGMLIDLFNGYGMLLAFYDGDDDEVFL